jgi:acyl-CoA thioesterase-1
MNLFPSGILQAVKHSLVIGALGLAALVTACGGPAAPAAAPETPAPVAAPEAEAPRAATVVVFLGDSLTAGYGLEPQQALPQQVEAVWKANGFDAVAINAGVSGDTTANGLARFDWSVAEAKPDLVVIALGANDYLMGVPPDVARGNLAAILDRSRDAGIPAVLVGLAPRGDIQPGSREAAYAAIYPELAREYSVPYYPSLLGDISADPALLQADGLHPTAEGVVLIAKPLAEFLVPSLSASAPHTE